MRPVVIRAFAGDLASVTMGVPEDDASVDLIVMPTSGLDVTVLGAADRVIARSLVPGSAPIIIHGSHEFHFEQLAVGEYVVNAGDAPPQQVAMTAEHRKAITLAIPAHPTPFAIHVTGRACTAVELRGATTTRSDCRANEAYFQALPGHYVACIDRYCERIEVTASSTWFELDVE